MKRLVFLMFLLPAMFALLPLSVSAERAYDGKGKDRDTRRKSSAAVRKAVEAKRRAAAEAARRRAVHAAAVRAKAFDAGLKSKALANIANDNAVTDDPVIRNAAINALGNHAGTVVVMDTQTGKIITMVNQEMAVRQAVKPCSTIKLVTALTAIDQKVILNPATDKKLEDAIANSDNYYFQRAGLKVGNEKFIKVAQDQGLGKPTGINLPNENPGKLPYGLSGKRIYSHGDGSQVTAVQLAVMVSAIATGKRVTPFIPNPTLGSADKTTTPVSIPTDELKGVIPGMKGSANYGTAHRGGMDSNLGVAAKTGTCSGLGLVATVAPVDTPKYTVVVITHGTKEKGRNASFIANQVYQALMPAKPVVAQLKVDTPASKVAVP